MGNVSLIMSNEAPPENVRDENVREKMQQVARMVDEEIPANWGFIVMVFPLGDQSGRLNYVTNGKREDVLAMLTRFIEEARHQEKWGRNV